MKELHLLALDYRCAVLPDDAHEAWIELEEYVKQLINEEREACAKVCENGTFLHEFSPEAVYSRACARSIRARGQ
jgi:hypothetical protein